ncbi:DUF6268 family outer membrane beta-barrel protein [Flavobacterium sp. UGB4466]|uniref:DUF6268 family outer membrane beta-barrel protein n=1 Tax=Flavobacterium sp. UGB4466 TaxID=2730889 RepID=UPI00192BC130|nr:DUF6268 family outer membrane beta-barrel protein [Flavobacterium sp. UGB4466]
MKIRILIRSFFLISFFSMEAQETIGINLDLKTEPTAKADFTESSIVLSYSKKTDTKNKITNTLAYSNLNVNYEAGSYKTQENQEHFNQIKNNFKISHDFSNTFNMSFSIVPTVNFQSSPGLDDTSLLGSLEMSQQFNSKARLTIGISRSAVLGNPKFLPVVSFNYKFSNESSLLIGFPDSKISYSNNIRNTFNLTNSFNGNFYHLDEAKQAIDNAAKATLSQMTTAFEYERNVDKNWFLNFKAGYDFDKKYSRTDKDNHRVYDFNTGNSYVLGIGIKYKQ